MDSQRQVLPTANTGNPDPDPILTIPEVAADLRCSRAHVYNVINGTVDGVSPLPALQLGRRKLVRRSTLERWKEANESIGSDGNLGSAKSERR
jgi:excisionase family DNA binding protein